MDFAKSKELKRVLDDLKRGEKEVGVSGLWGSAQALLLSSLPKKLSRPVLVLTSDEEKRIEMEEDLRIFGLSHPILSFPSEGMNERLSCLFHLLSSVNFLLIAEEETIKEKIISPDDFLKFSSKIKVNEDLKRESFIKGLVSSGYEGAPMIERRGEFSIRGGIIDIWSPQDENPLRIELFGEKIESLRRFDPVTQRSIEKTKEARIIPFTSQGKATLFDYLPKNTLIVITEEILDFRSQISDFQLLRFFPFFQEGAIDFITQPMENFHRKIGLLRERIEKWQKENYRIFIML